MLIVHVAQLDPGPFREILCGEKSVEYRERVGRDRMIESLVAGSMIVFRQCGPHESTQLVVCEGVPRRVTRRGGGYRYEIPVSIGRLIHLYKSPPKVQGWRMRDARWRGRHGHKRLELL